MLPTKWPRNPLHLHHVTCPYKYSALVNRNSWTQQGSIVVVGGWIRLIVGFLPLMVISPTASWIRWCMQVYVLMWTCLVWAEQSTPDSFYVPSHRFNSATGEQKWITQTIYTDSEPPSRMPNSLMPSAKLRSANLPLFTTLVWRDRGSNPGLPHPERTL